MVAGVSHNRLTSGRDRTGIDPAAERRDLGGAERRAGRRHTDIGVCRLDPRDQPAVGGIPGHDHRTIVAPFEQVRSRIKPQAGLLSQRPMARNAAAPQQRFDVAEVIDPAGFVVYRARGILFKSTDPSCRFIGPRQPM